MLGGVLLRNDVLHELDTLEVDAFYDHRHRAVFQAMRNLEAAARPIDVVTVELELQKAGKLEAIGGMAFLGQLALQVPTADNVVVYAKAVQDHARVRGVMLAASDIAERGYAGDMDADEYLSMAMAAIARHDNATADTTVGVGDLVQQRVRELEDLAARRSRGENVMAGVPTGIAELDKKLGGYPLGDVSLLAARPAMGKTSMAMACVDTATAAGYGAHVFTKEGGWRMYADRCISRGSGISVERLRAGDLAGEDAAAIAQAMLKFRARQNWKVDARAGLTASEIIRRVRRWRRKLNTKLVVVDYVQIVKRTKGLSENEALDEIITAFSHAALADDIAYLVLCQLNRECEKRPDKRPQLSDLRGSGALEERPRVIVSPYRGAAYYDEPKKDIDYDCNCVEGAPCWCAPKAEDFQASVQVLVLKNNNGQTGRVFASWRPETTEMW